jgi:hypothetical protein
MKHLSCWLPFRRRWQSPLGKAKDRTGARGENALRLIGGNPESSHFPAPPASRFDLI